MGVEVTEEAVTLTVQTGTYTGFSDHITLTSSVSLGDVKADFAAALERRATADAQKVSIDVNGSDVTLTGTVHSWADKELATHSAWSTPGVHNVMEKISIVFQSGECTCLAS